MAIRYYKKLEPRTAVVLPNNTSVRFNTDHTGLLGYMATDDAGLQQGFEACMRMQRGGITEITADEFTRNYLEPKKNGIQPQRLWREEYGNSVTGYKSPLERLGDAVAQAVGISARKPDPPVAAVLQAAEIAATRIEPPPPPKKEEPPAAGPAPVPVPVVPKGPIEFTPKAGKRRGRPPKDAL